MIIGKTINVIDSHTAGEATRIIISGVPYLPGGTLIEKAEYFRDHFDYIRTALFQEPRGLLRGEGALITSPTSAEAQLGVLFMNAKSWLVSMCGHGSIGVITAAIEFGMVDTIEPITKVILETPAGLVPGYAKVQGGTVESVSILNVPSFLYQSTTVDVLDFGAVPVDIAYGGAFFAIIEASDIGVSIDLKNASWLYKLSAVIKEAANSQVNVWHPQKPFSKVDGVRFYNKPSCQGEPTRSMTIFEGAIDRSPCGAGTSAYLAALYAKGQIELNEESLHESIIGTVFNAKLVSQTKVNEFDAVTTEITGSAYTTGINTFVLSQNDPMKNGFLIEV